MAEEKKHKVMEFLKWLLGNWNLSVEFDEDEAGKIKKVSIGKKW